MKASALHVLDRPLEIYDRFNRSETRKLRAYVTSTRRLGDMSYFGQVPRKMTMRMGTGLAHEMDEPHDEAVRAAVTQIRQLYTDTEPTSYRATFKLLKRNVRRRDSPYRKQALEALSEHTQSLTDGLDHGMTAMIVLENPKERIVMDARSLIDAYFHGYYLHSGNAKSELVRQLDDIGPLPRYEFYGLMLQIRNVFWAGANVIDRVLRHPELITE